MPCCLLPLVRSGQANMRVSSPAFPFVVSSLAVVPSAVLPSYPSFRARTTIRSADVSPSRIASEKIGLAPASQLLGPAILQSRELVASSWHGLGRLLPCEFYSRPRRFASRSRIGTSRYATGNITRLICVRKHDQSIISVRHRENKVSFT